MGGASSVGMFAIWPILIILVYLVSFVLGIYCLVLFIKLAHRGIKALDLYIEEKSNRNRT